MENGLFPHMMFIHIIMKMKNGWQSKLRNEYFNFIIIHEKYGDFQHKQRRKKTTQR